MIMIIIVILSYNVASRINLYNVHKCFIKYTNLSIIILVVKILHLLITYRTRLPSGSHSPESKTGLHPHGPPVEEGEANIY